MSPRSTPYVADRPIIAELAAGAVVQLRGSGEILILHDPSEDRWCFPKGHVEAGESLEGAARREVTEETGITEISFEGELREVHYRFYRPKDACNVHKSVVYFLARTTTRTARPEAMFDRAEWVSVAEALRRIRFEADRQVLAALSDRP
jgi:8-oxo-dGTP pyrophosphatase MutT (NUDIX family)